MTLQEKRIKIAEACGWKLANRVLPEYANSAIMCWICPGDSEWEESQIPDYFNDLNAMQFAEKVLTENVTYMQRHAFNNYAYRLIEMCKHQCNAVSAPAAQRAEAFGKTLNLW